MIVAYAEGQAVEPPARHTGTVIKIAAGTVKIDWKPRQSPSYLKIPGKLRQDRRNARRRKLD